MDPVGRSPVVLSATDLAVLDVLRHHRGRVVSRDTIRRLARLDGLSERRIDSCIVVIRRYVGHDNLVTVRRRGWMLTDTGVVDGEEMQHP